MYDQFDQLEMGCDKIQEILIYKAKDEMVCDMTIDIYIMVISN